MALDAPMLTDMDKAAGSATSGKDIDSLIKMGDENAKAASKDIEKYHSDISKIMSSMPDPNSIPKPKVPQTQPFQAPQAEDPINAFGSFGTALGLIASALTRTPLTTAFKSAAAGMNAVKANNQAAYDQALESWKANTDLAYKQATWENDSYKSALELMQTDYNKGLANIKTIALMAQDEPVLRMLNRPYEIASLLTERQRLTTEGLNASDKAYTLGRKKQLDMALQTARASGDPAAIEKAQQAIQDFQSVESPYAASVASVKLRDAAALEKAAVDEFKAKNGGREPSFDEMLAIKQKIAGAGKAQSPQQVALEQFLREHPDATADQIAAFNQKNRAAARSAPAMATQKYIEEHPEATAEDVMNFGAQYRARGNAVSAFATGKQADIIRSFNVATQHLDTLQKLGEALQNKDVQSFNRIANQFAAETGQTAPTNFDAAKTIIGNEITKAVIGVGGTGEDRNKAQSAFDRAQSPEQLKQAIDTVRSLIKGQLVGIERQYVDTTGQSEQDFRKRLSGAALRELGGTYQKGDILERGGRKYRVTGGNPTDPDVEPVQ